jgi:hypothetical protein
VGQGSIPNVQDAMMDWWQDMSFNLVTKTTVAFKVVETITAINFRGVINPFTGRQLMIKPEGQRAWRWFEVFSDPALQLKPDDILVYNGIQTRVMYLGDWSIYGFMQYHLVQDWQ